MIYGIYVIPYVKRGHLRHLACDLGLLLLDEGLVLELLEPFLAQFVQRLSEVFLHFRIASKGGTHLIYAVGEVHLHVCGIDLQGVYPGLAQEQIVGHQVFKDVAAERPVRCHSLCAGNPHLVLYVSDGNHLVAHQGHSLVNYPVVPLCGSRKAKCHKGGHRRSFECMDHTSNKLSTSLCQARRKAVLFPDCSARPASWCLL